MWDLILRCQGQVRTDWGHVTGLDLGAVLAMGAALGVPAQAVGEFAPFIEAELVKGRAARRRSEDDDWNTETGEGGDHG